MQSDPIDESNPTTLPRDEISEYFSIIAQMRLTDRDEK